MTKNINYYSSAETEVQLTNINDALWSISKTLDKLLKLLEEKTDNSKDKK